MRTSSKTPGACLQSVDTATTPREADDAKVHGRWRLWPVLATPVGLGAFVLALFNLGVLVAAWNVPATDYGAFYAAAHAYGRSPELLYTVDFQREVQEQLGFPVFLPFFHLPYELLLFMPLARLDFDSSLLVWRALNLSLIYVPLAILSRQLFRRRLSLPLTLVAGLAFFPLVVCVLRGQDSIVLLTLYALAFAAFARGAEHSAGLWLGLGLFKPHLVLAVIAIAALQRRWRMVLGFGGSAALILAISLAMVGLTGMRDWAAMVLASQGEAIAHMAIDPGRMPNLRGLVVLLGGDGILVAGIALPLAAAMLFLTARRSNRTADRDLVFASAACLSVLVSFHMHSYDLALLLVPIAVLAAKAAQQPGFRRPLDLLPALIILFSPVFFALLVLDTIPLLALPIAGLWLTLLRVPALVFCPAPSEGTKPGQDCDLVAP